MDLGLRGKVAAITGGSEGLGRATAFRLSEEGARVAICARRQALLQKTAHEIAAATGGEILVVRADVTNAADCALFIQRTIERFGRLDILVNKAWCSAAMSFEQGAAACWADLEGTLVGAIRCTRLAIPQMRKQGGGRIINITTIGGKQPDACSLPTGVTQAMGITLTKALAKEYAAENVLVNSICLGYIKSTQWPQRWQAHSPHLTLDEFYAREGQTIPLLRLGEAEEVADLVCFLVSERARYITGTTIDIDGGLSGVV